MSEAFVVGEDFAGQRLDRFLAQAAAGFSRTRLKALIEDGCVRIDGEIASDPARKLSAGASVALDAPPLLEAPVEGQDIPLDVVFEDEHLVVINKPAGLVVHPAPGHPDGTLVNALIRHCGASLSGIGGVKRPGIVHRLDKDTSGLLVAAKTDAAHQGLADLFADHGRTGSLVREYAALAWNDFRVRSGTVDAAIGRHRYARERMSVSDAADARHAVTHWRVEEPLGLAAWLSCRLETGRTHQIRVHLAHIGHPLLGDSVYGGGFKTKANKLDAASQGALAALNRQALHAQTLGFEHPVTSEQLHLQRPPPQDFLNLASALRV